MVNGKFMSAFFLSLSGSMGNVLTLSWNQTVMDKLPFFLISIVGLFLLWNPFWLIIILGLVLLRKL